jgi:hypothetical protein
MILLLAHHDETIELYHLPVLAVFLGVGIWLGWRMTSALLERTRRSPAPKQAA